MTFQTSRRSYLRLSVLVGGAALGLTACGKGAEAGGPVTLRFTWWGGDVRHKLTQKIIENFNAENPDITVKGEYSDWNGYWDKLATQVAGNDAPDIIQMDEKYVREYGDRGALLDLNTLKKIKTTDFEKHTLDTGVVNGKQVALVTGLGTVAIAANVKIFEKAGIPLPDDKTWSWDDYLALGKTIAQKLPGTTGLGVGYTDQDLYIWARQQGDKVYDDDSNVVIKPETLVSFWATLLKATKMGAAGTPSEIIEGAAMSLDQSPMATGKMAMNGIWNTQLPAFAAAKSQELKLLRVPGESTAKARGAYYKSSMFWSASSRTKHQPEVELFLDYLANNQDAGALLLAERGVPANMKTRAAIAGKLDPAGQTAVDFLTAIADEVRPAPPITPVGGSAINAILGRYASDILFERVTPEKAAPAFIAELKQSIKK